MPTIKHDDLTIPVTQEQLDRWEAAARRLAEAEREYAEATADRWDVIDAFERDYYASLPPRDPDAPPPGPVRDLFPRIGTTARPLFDGLDRFNVPRSAR